MEACGRVWILSGWQIVIEQMPKLGDAVWVRTWPYAFKGFMGSRNYEMTDREGKRLAVANSLWTLIDMKERTPVRIVPSDIEGYVIEEKADMEYAPRKIKVAGEGVPQEPVFIGRERIDTNGHMNNGQYISLAAEYVPDGVRICQMRAEYKKEVRYHDLLQPVVYASDGTVLVELYKEEQVCAVVEICYAQ